MLHVIQLPSDLKSGFYWLQISDEGQLESQTFFSDFDALEQFEDIKHVSILLPSQHVALLKAVAPKVSARDLSEVMRFAVEDQLSEDIDSLHFVKGAYDGQIIQVAVIRNDLMRELYDRLKRYGLNITGMIPDCLVLPLEDQSWTVAMTAETVLIRRGLRSGMRLERSHFPLIWSMLCRQCLPGDKPSQLIVYGTRDPESERVMAQWPEVPIAWCAEAYPYDMRSFNQHGVLNLLTPPYRLVTRMSRNKRRWAIFLGTLVGSVLIMLLVNLVALGYMNHQKRRLDSRFSALLARVDLPGQDRNTIRSTLMHELEVYQWLQKNNDFLGLSRRLGAALQEAPVWQVDKMNYVNRVMTVSLMTQDGHPAPLGAVLAKLQQGGVHIEKQTALEHDAYVLIIRRGA